MKTFDLLIIDGRHLLYRCSDAYKTLTTTVDGEEVFTGSVYGFLGTLIRLYRKFKAKTVIAWEGSDNFRFNLFPGYKARDEKQRLLSEELDVQQAFLSRFLVAAGVRQFSGLRCEADDVIGRLSKLQGYRIGIYSGDSDLRQLVNDSVTVVVPDKGHDRPLDAAAVEERHGVPPRMIAALKALAGDHSDKIPGVPGVGEKTAVAILRAYSDRKSPFESALRSARDKSEDWPVSERFRQLIVDHEKEARLYLELTTIRTIVELVTTEPKKDRDSLMRMLKRYKFSSIAFSSDFGTLLKLG